MAIQTITLIGTGNLAWHLGKAFAQAGLPITHLAGHTYSKAEELAHELNCSYFSDLTTELPATDLYIICVRDSAIDDVAKLIYRPGRLIVHTSGATSIEVLHFDDNQYGAIWPMQTLVKGNEIDYKQMLVCVTGSDEATTQLLGGLAQKISGRVEEVSDEQRAILHMAAVWVNNFTNHMFDIADSILKEHNLPFELMIPMIRDMMEKVGSAPPSQLQTGPAKRGDNETIDKHLKLLETHPEWSELYYHISRSILHHSIKE